MNITKPHLDILNACKADTKDEKETRRILTEALKRAMKSAKKEAERARKEVGRKQ
jgi:hypothetical protein